MKKIIIYTTPSCHYCDEAKKFFDANKITYTSYNVASDMERRQEMINMSGARSVPVITIGKEVLVGFDEKKVKEILGL